MRGKVQYQGKDLANSYVISENSTNLSTPCYAVIYEANLSNQPISHASYTFSAKFDFNEISNQNAQDNPIQNDVICVMTTENGLNETSLFEISSSLITQGCTREGNQITFSKASAMIYCSYVCDTALVEIPNGSHTGGYVYNRTIYPINILVSVNLTGLKVFTF